MYLEKLGFILILIGIVIAFIAILIPLFTIPLTGDIKISGGGCIILFFIPICFGYGEFAIQLIMLAIALAIVLAIVYLVIYKTSIGALKRERAEYI
ncbi:MAG: hypothetical protein QXV81_07235 [Ignisphaera sp.]|uniref:DUF131 domain-containing protein n=1 Tax=Ignisphaera aggregans TaxID=334771 RepID=A0A7J3JT64_9CREN